MLFLLATPESNIVETKTTKIRVHLSSGIAEILEDHQDLMGKIDNDVVEFETNFDNKVETAKYLVQQGVFVVSTKNTISANSKIPETAVYVYGKRIFEVNSKIKVLLDDISKEFEEKNIIFQKEEQEIQLLKDEKKGQPLNSYELMKSSNFLLLKQDLEFLKKVIFIIKQLK
jgi:F0F1-type ATP synthase epsilon subunit